MVEGDYNVKINYIKYYKRKIDQKVHKYINLKIRKKICIIIAVFVLLGHKAVLKSVTVFIHIIFVLIQNAS